MMPLPVRLAVVAIPARGVSLESPQLDDSGNRLIQGVSMRLFTNTNLSAGTRLELELSGWPPDSRPPSGIALSNLIYGISGLLLSLIAVASWLTLKTREAIRQTSQVEEDASLNDLLDAIITLDDLHRLGELPDEAYHQRRAELKEQLRIASKESGQTPV